MRWHLGFGNLYLEPDDPILIKLQTLTLSGNGAALILLGSYMNKSDTPIAVLQDHAVYFLPFIIALSIATFGVFAGIFASSSRNQQANLSEMRAEFLKPDSVSFRALQQSFTSKREIDGEKSKMSDKQLKDLLISTLASNPELGSPGKYHKIKYRRTRIFLVALILSLLGFVIGLMNLAFDLFSHVSIFRWNCCI